jgi:hypothetical protein
VLFNEQQTIKKQLHFKFLISTKKLFQEHQGARVRTFDDPRCISWKVIPQIKANLGGKSTKPKLISSFYQTGVNQLDPRLENDYSSP